MSEQALYTSIPWIPNDEKRAKYEEKDNRVAYGEHRVEGVFTARRSRDQFDKTKGKYYVLTLTLDNGQEVDVHCRGAALFNKVREEKPRFGERITVAYLGLKETPNYPQPYENYQMRIHRESGGDLDWDDGSPEVQEPVHTIYDQSQAVAAAQAPAPAPAPAPPASQNADDDIPF